MKNIYGIYGASGFGREVLPLLRQTIGNNQDLYFIDDALQGDALQYQNSVKVVSFEYFTSIKNTLKSAVIAIANGGIRAKLTQRCKEHNISMINVADRSACIYDEVNLGEGHILTANTVLTSNITIGKSFHANLLSYVGHDCRIGDFVTFAPGVKCNGNVHIGHHVYIGTGVIIKQGTLQNPITIGENVIIGAGAVISKSIPSNTKVLPRDNRLLSVPIEARS